VTATQTGNPSAPSRDAPSSGRLPVEIPSRPSGQPHTYLHAPLGGRRSELSNLDPTPLFPFGHGLSYTTFAVEELTADAREVPTDGQVSVQVGVRNTGGRAGAHVVQLYSTGPIAQVARPVRQLLGFAKVHLEPGQRATVSFDVHTDRFAFAGLDCRPGPSADAGLIVEPGTITLAAGHSSTDLPAEFDLQLTGPVRRLDRRRVHSVPYVVFTT